MKNGVQTAGTYREPFNALLDRVRTGISEWAGPMNISTAALRVARASKAPNAANVSSRTA
jgi:hypothetical protein